MNPNPDVSVFSLRSCFQIELAPRSVALGVALIVGSSMFSGCHTTRDPSISEHLDADGIVSRTELVDADEREAQASPQVLRARMEAYLEAKRAGTLHFALRADADAAFDPFVERDCPPEGSATPAAKQAANRLKNRISKPKPADMEAHASFEALREPGDDRHRWSTDQAAVIEAYVRSVKGTGAESCNCGETARALTDTHIDLATGPDDDGRPVIVEITPPWRLLHSHAGLEDWSSKALKSKYEGHRVRFTGWLFFDAAHLLEADNTDPGDHHGKANWRATCWEIHPVTDIEIIE